MEKLKQWYTKPSYNMLLKRVQTTLNYLEKVGERPTTEELMSKDVARLEKWVFGSTLRAEDIHSCKERYRDIQQKRRLV